MDFLQQQGIRVKVIPGMQWLSSLLNLIIKLKLLKRVQFSISKGKAINY
jgi:hypothetical protein